MQRTLHEHFRTGESLLKNRKFDQSIGDLINSTDKQGTFYKRVSSIRYYLCKTIKNHLDLFYEHQHEKFLIEASDLLRISKKLLISKNLKIVFARASSKRTALRGFLPSDWVEELINYNRNSKYRTTFILMSVMRLQTCWASNWSSSIHNRQ